jgi:hypothetical protein
MLSFGRRYFIHVKQTFISDYVTVQSKQVTNSFFPSRNPNAILYVVYRTPGNFTEKQIKVCLSDRLYLILSSTAFV